MIDEVLDYVLKATGLPRPVWALVAGTLAAFGFTQRVKFMLPAKWTKHAREVTTQAIGFASGFLATYVIWAGFKLSIDAFVVALVVGLWTPALWNVLMLVIGWWKPSLRDALSQSTRPSDTP